MDRIEYQIIDKESGMVSAYSDTFSCAIHYLGLYCKHSPHELYMVSYKHISDSGIREE